MSTAATPAPALAMPASVPVTIDGKPAFLSFDNEHFYLHRVGQGKPYSSLAEQGPYDPAKASLLIPLALVLHASFVSDIDGGSLLVNVLSPPLTTSKSLAEAIGISKKGSKAQSIFLSRPTNGTNPKTQEESVSTTTTDELAHASASASATAQDTLVVDDDIRQADHLRTLLDGPCSNLRLIKIEARLETEHLPAPDPSTYASHWTTALLARAYPSEKGITPHRRLFVLVNPAGGPGKARTLFENRVRPILEAAGCVLNVHYTTHHLHGFALVRDTGILKLDATDAIVTVSGDGMVHEVLNALAVRPDARQALQIPLAPIPAGSGNASAVNLLGPKNGFSLALASLNVVKGRKMALDLCTVTQPWDGPESDPYAKASLEPPGGRGRGAKTAAGPDNGTRAAGTGTGSRRINTASQSLHSVAPSEVGPPGEGDATNLDASPQSLSSATASRLLPHHTPTSSTNTSVDADPTALTTFPTRPYVQYHIFLSAAIGLMADIDLGTEHMRALGDARFVIGYLQGVMSNRECAVDVFAKFGEGGVDRAEMRRGVRRSRARGGWVAHQDGEEDGDGEGEGGRLDVPLRHGSVLDPLTTPGGPPLPPLNLYDPSWPIPALQPAPTAPSSDEPSTAPEGTTADDTDADADDQSPNTTTTTTGWTHLKQPISALYAGKMPYVSRDLLQFPFSHPSDSLIDLALLLHSSGRLGKLRSIASAENGEVVYDRDLGYAKVSAVRVVPRVLVGRRLKGGGMVSMDGEGVAYAPFQLEVTQGVSWFALSLYGGFACPLVMPPGSSTEAEAALQLAASSKKRAQQLQRQ